MSQAQHVAATISQMSGSVTVDRYGKSVELKLGDPIYATDTIKTGSGSVEVSFIDGAKAMLGPNSVMSVQEFSMGSEKEEASFVLNLASGALRTISGAVVEQNPDAFKVITPKATAGIRGTDFSTHVFADGSERFVLISLDQGHNLVVTTHTGQQLSLTTSNEGAEIGEDGTTVTPVKYTKEEVEEIVQQIMSALQGEEDVDSATTDQVTLLLDSATAQALEAAGLLDDFVESATQAGASVGIEDGEEFLEPPTVTELLDSNDDGGGEGSSLVSVSATGQEPYFADDIVPTAGNTYFMTSEHITVENPIASNSVIISGDLNEMAAGTVNAGSDSISVPSMSGGTVVGDVTSMNGGTLYAGNDSITIMGDKTGGNSLYGDVAGVESGELYFGHDSIVVQGSFSNSTIAGDARDIGSSTVQQWGNDTIRIEGDVMAETSSVTIYGDSSWNGDVGGNDSIYIGGSVIGIVGRIEIYGGGGSDTIHIAKDNGPLNGGGDGATIDGGAGNDVITIGGHTGGAVLGGAGNDTITAFDLGGGLSVEGGDGDDFITSSFGESSGSNGIAGGAGNDTLHITIAGTGFTDTGDVAIDMGEDGSANTYADKLYLTTGDSSKNYEIKVVGFDFDHDTLYVENGKVDVSSLGINDEITVDNLTIYFR